MSKLPKPIGLGKAAGYAGPPLPYPNQTEQSKILVRCARQRLARGALNRPRYRFFRVANGRPRKLQVSPERRQSIVLGVSNIRCGRSQSAKLTGLSHLNQRRAAK